MDATFIGISNNLIKSDFDTELLKLFQIENLERLTDHVAGFIGCDPFRAELAKIQDDLDKYNVFQMKSEELMQDSKQNDNNNDKGSFNFIEKMQNKWI